MTCDDENSSPSMGTQEKRDLKRKLDSQTFSNDTNNPEYNVSSDTVNKISSGNCIKILKSDSETPNQALLVHGDQENTKNVYNKRKVAPKHSRRKKKRLEIETEFKILQSLIPQIANKQTINELEIIDACVNYIEALQEQLNIRNPEDKNGISQSDNAMSTSIRSIMSVINDEKVEAINPFHSVQDDEMDEYLKSESSEEDYTEDEIDGDNNNNKETTTKEHNTTENNERTSNSRVDDRNIREDNLTSNDRKCPVGEPADEFTSIIT